MKKLIFLFLSYCIVACTPSTHYVKSEPSVRSDFENDSLTLASSGYIGCPASEIAISNVNVRPYDGAKSWKATCKNIAFYCSEIRYFGGSSGLKSVALSCKEEI